MTVGERQFTAEERAAGLLFRLRDSLKSRDKIERGGATLVGSGTTFGASGMTLNGSGWLNYTGFSSVKSTRAGMTIVIDFTWGEAINAAAQRVWFGSGALQYLMFKQQAAGNHRLDIYAGGTLLFPIAYSTWSAAVVAGKNTFVLSLASGGSIAWLNGTVIGTSVTAWVPSRTAGLVVGAYYDGSTPVVGTFHRFEIYGFAATAVDEPYLRAGTLISALDEPLIVLPGTSAWRDTTDSNKYKTEVRGKAGITSALLGSTGLVTTEFPSIIRPRGFSFDGGDQINLGDSDLLSFTDGVSDKPFSIAMLVSGLARPASSSLLVGKATASAVGEYQVFLLVVSGSLRFYFTLIDNSAAGWSGRYGIVPDNTLLRQAVVVVTSDGVSPANNKIYVDKTRVDTTAASGGGAYTRMRNTTANLLFGSTATYVSPVGTQALQQMFDYELSPLQVKALTARLHYQARRG